MSTNGSSGADPPPPLAPPDCDLRGLEWMPLFGARLFSSDFNARASDEEFRAAVNLWWACWQQMPAGSLPNDDHVLCGLAGLARDHKTWKRLRAAGNVLHGFVRCTDGRLYHKVQAAQATDAWERRVKERERKANWRSRKEAYNGGGPNPGDGDETGTVPILATGTDNGTERGRDVDVPADRKRQDRTGQEKKGRKEDARVTARRQPSNPFLATILEDGLAVDDQTGIVVPIGIRHAN